MSEHNESLDNEVDIFGNSADDDVTYLDDDEVVLSDSSETESDHREDDETDDSSVTFAKHTDTVFSIAIKDNVVISGGADNAAFVWDAENGNLIAELVGHKDSVIDVHLNRNEQYVATGDMCGVVIIWDTEQWQMKHTLESVDDMVDMTWMFWHHSANVIFRGFHSGMIAMNASSSSSVKYFGSDDSPCTCGKLLPDGVRLVAGYEDGSSKIWNLREGSSVVVAGNDPVNCVEVLDDRVGARGTRNGTFALFSLTNGAIYSNYSISQFTETLAEEVSVETVAFDPTKSLLSVSGIHCPLIFFDMPNGRARAVFADINRVAKTLWLNGFLLSSSLDGVVHLWDSRSLEIKTEWRCHKTSIYDVAVNVQRNFFVTGDKDGVCKVFPLHL